MKHFSPSNTYDIIIFSVSASLAFASIIIILFQQESTQNESGIIINNGNVYTVNKAFEINTCCHTGPSGPVWIISPHRYRIGNTLHYKTAISGNLHIIAILNNSKAVKSIYICAPNPDTLPVVLPRAVITGPAQVFAGTPYVYYTRNDTSFTCQWRLLGDSTSFQTGSSCRITFRHPGEQHLTLTLNNDPSTTTIKTIQVLAPADRKPSPTLVIPEPLPVIPVAATPAPPIISDPAFHQLLLQLLEGKKPAEELMKYLCNQQETVVIINDKETTSFLQCCAQLQHKKNIRLISLSLARSKQGCIEALRIRYDKKKFIGLF